MTKLRICCILLLLAFSAAVVYGQAVSATLLGNVTDVTGAVVLNAKVTVLEQNTNTTRSGVTNESGNYTFPDLPPGLYSVTVENPGFKKETRTGINVTVNTATRIDVRLQPGSVNESVEVTGAPPPIQTDRADTGLQIDVSQITNIPLGTSRNFQGLLNLVPGTTRATFQHSQFFNATGSLQTEVNGQMRQGNSYQIEGIDDNERTGLLQILIPPIEAIQTVDVSTSNFEAELGRASGANTNVILKSGSNDFHGAAYEFLRNSEFNARNFFDVSVGHQAYNYFGGNVGGPIKKNKIFFFGDFLRVTDHQANTNLGTIPPGPWRTGDLSQSATPIYDPASGNPDGTSRTQFAGNVIPLSRINAISAKIMALVPGTNQSTSLSAPSNNYFALLPFTKDTNSFDVKIDDNLSDKDRISGRFSFSRPVVNQAALYGESGGWAQGAFAGTGIQKTYSTGINYSRILSPSLITEVRVGVAHYRNDVQQPGYGKQLTTQLGIPGVNIDDWTSGMISININGGFSTPLVGFVNSEPWKRAEANIDFVNVWTKTMGNHTIKWGADYRRLRDDLLQTQTINPRGLYTFDTAQSSIPGAKTGIANNMASFLLDMPSSAGRDLAIYFPAMRGHQFFAFVQDKWQASAKLTLDFGLRWEFYPPPTPRLKAGFSNYDWINNQLVVAGVGDNPMNMGMQTQYKYFAPRLGAAYRLTPTTVFRAGFGISYTPFPDNTWAYNFPVKQNNQFNTGQYNYQAAVLSDGVTPATFERGFPAPVPAVIPSNGIIPVTGSLASQSLIVIPKDFKNPYVESWNLSMQQALPYHFTIDAAYVGNHGVRTVATYNWNVPTDPSKMGLGNVGRPQYPRTADSLQYFRGFSSMYNGLQMKLNRRMTNGLSVITSYTFAKGMAFQTGDDGGIWTYINSRRSYARTDFDRTHTFNQSYVYDLPFGPGKKWMNSGIASKVIGGWQVNGVLTLMTGTPMTFGADGSVLNTPGSPQTADQVGPFTVLGGINTPSKGGSPWFLQSSFVQPTGVRFGTSGRNIASGPGFFNLDASMFKTFTFVERYKLEIRGESFGVTNTPQFSNPTTAVNNSNYGYITGAGGGRGVQLGAKVTF
jgi:hypothetical protein